VRADAEEARGGGGDEEEGAGADGLCVYASIRAYACMRPRVAAVSVHVRVRAGVSCHHMARACMRARAKWRAGEVNLSIQYSVSLEVPTAKWRAGEDRRTR
jgi:hypothetical protein